MKKLLTIALCLLLSGCSAGKVNDRLLVYAIGVDLEEGEYKISYQVFTAKGESASSPVNVDEQNVTVMSVNGGSVQECDRLLSLQTGKDVFSEDAEVIILGESVDEQTAARVIAEYIYDKEVYIGCGVCYTNGSAEDALNIGQAGLKDPHSLGEILDLAFSDGFCPSLKLVDLYILLVEKKLAVL